MGHLHHHHHAHPRDAAELEKRQTVVNVVFVTETPNGGPPPPVTVAPPPKNTFIVGAPVRHTPTAEATKGTPIAPPPASSSKEAPETTDRAKGSPLATSRESSSTETGASTSTSITSSASSTNTAASSSDSSSSSASSDGKGGLSGGSAAGLALGLIALIAIVAGLIFFIYRRKKQNAGLRRLDDEKTMNEKASPPPPVYVSAPAPAPAPAPVEKPFPAQPSTARSLAAAPRLSLRPVTQFSPDLNDESANRGPQTSNGLLAVAPQPVAKDDSAQRNLDTTNPFGIYAEKAELPSPTTPVTPIAPEPAPSVFAVPPPSNDALRSEAMSGKVPDSGRVSPPDFQPPRPRSPGAASFMSTNSDAYTEAGDVAPVAGAGGPPASNVHRVQLDFTPTMDDELEVRAGQLVRVLHQYDDGWALCIRMDRSQQGVVPRSCLSKHPLKPRQPGPRHNRGPPPPGMRGPPPPFAGPPPRPLSPGGRSGRNSPGPFGGPQRPASPGGPHFRPASPAHRNGGGRSRSNSNAPYMGPPRSMSPGPYGGGQQRPPGPNMRRRSNSVGDLVSRRMSPPGPSPLNSQGNGNVVARKPVPGMAI